MSAAGAVCVENRVAVARDVLQRVVSPLVAEPEPVANGAGFAEFATVQREEDVTLVVDDEAQAALSE